MIVNDGLAPPLVGNSDASQIHRLGMSHVRPNPFVTLKRIDRNFGCSACH